MCWLTDLFRGKTPQEIPKPSDWIPRKAITITPDGDVVFEVASAIKKRFGLERLPQVKEWPVISKSMRPSMGRGNEYIYISGRTPEDHQKLVAHLDVGDIAVYQIDKTRTDQGYAMHRIVEIKDGVYTFKGDYNPVPDPHIIKSEHIRYIVVILSY